MKYLLPLVAALALVGQGCLAPKVTEQSTPEPVQIETNEQIKPEPTESMSDYTFPGVLPEAEAKVNVRLKTNQGDIMLEIHPEYGPNAASNFVYLVKQGFYNNLTFHRREEGFVIQGGDPLGNGTGGPGYQFPDDPVDANNPLIKPFPQDDRFVLYTRGTLAMANAGPNTNGSQFFIMLDDVPLPPAYSIFGRVAEGMDAVDKIHVGDRIQTAEVE